MKHISQKSRRSRETGAALITALMIAVATAMVLSAGLTVALSSSQLGWNQAYSESAMQLAEGGVNSELQVISQNVGAVSALLKSSQPIVATGVSLIYPVTGSIIVGRPGTVSGISGNYYVYSSNDAAGTTAWDGVTTPFYITSAACVNGCWQRVQVSSQSTSLFNVYGIFGLGSYSGAPTSITTAPSATVSITGPAAINGTTSRGSGSTITCPQAINANCGAHSSGQYTSGDCGGHLCSVTPPYVYPRTVDVCKQACGLPSTTSDATAWSTCQSHSCNQSCVYQYTSNATSSTLSTNNCTKCTNVGTTLTNSCFTGCNTNPSTYTSTGFWWFPSTVAVKTLIFEPGDYYFTKCQLTYDASCQIVIDSQAQACGGTPGQVRIWMYDPNSSTDGNPADYIQQPIQYTCASGQSTPDPGNCRIYYGKDGCTCTFSNPGNCTDWQGNSCGNFTHYCGVYACTKQPNDTSSTVGTCCGFSASTNSSAGNCTLCGSLLSDKLSFTGCCNITYTASQTCTKDPCAGASVLSWTKC